MADFDVSAARLAGVAVGARAPHLRQPGRAVRPDHKGTIGSLMGNASMERRLRRELARYPVSPERVETIVAEVLRLDPDGQFRFTDQYRRLLRELRLEWPDWQTMRVRVATSSSTRPCARMPSRKKSLT